MTDQQVAYALTLPSVQLEALANLCTQQSHDMKIRAKQIGDKQMLAAGRRAGSLSFTLTMESLKRELKGL